MGIKCACSNILSMFLYSNQRRCLYWGCYVKVTVWTLLSEHRESLSWEPHLGETWLQRCCLFPYTSVFKQKTTTSSACDSRLRAQSLRQRNIFSVMVGCPSLNVGIFIYWSWHIKHYTALTGQYISPWNNMSLQERCGHLPVTTGTFQYTCSKVFNCLPENSRTCTDSKKFAALAKAFLTNVATARLTV